MNCIIERVPLTSELRKELFERKLFNPSKGGSLNLEIISDTLNRIVPMGISAPEFVHIARVDGELVGWCFLVNSNFHNNLVSTFVTESYRCKGIGRQLVAHTSRDSKQNFICTFGASEFYSKVRPHTDKYINLLDA